MSFAYGQAGNMIPLDGESELRQLSTATDIMNIVMATGASTTAGSALVITRAGSTDSLPIFRTDYDGTWGLRKVINLSTASCAATLSASESGAFIVVGDSTGKDMTITLPEQAAGMWFEIYQGGAVKSSNTVIASATGDIIVGGKDADFDSVSLGNATGTAVGVSVRMISNGTKWLMIHQPAIGGAAPTTAAAGLFNHVD